MAIGTSTSINGSRLALQVEGLTSEARISFLQPLISTEYPLLPGQRMVMQLMVFQKHFMLLMQMSNGD